MNEPTTIEIDVRGEMREVKAPQSWDDLTRRQAMLYYNTLFSTAASGMKADAFTAMKLISITEDILGMGPDFLPRWEADCIAEDAEWGHLTFLEELKQVMLPALTGLFEIEEDEEGGTAWAVRFNMTRNLFPTMSARSRGKGSDRSARVRWYYAPKDGLENLTLYELAYTFGVYESYVRTGNDALVNTLIGAMYRPSRPETLEERESAWHGDRRQPLRRYEDKVEERARLAATLPLLTRRMIVFWFASCREAIVKRYPKVFVKSQDAKIGGSNYGWGGLLLRLAETGAFGPLEATSDQHYSNALTFLSMKDDDRRTMEAEMERIKKGRK